MYIIHYFSCQPQANEQHDSITMESSLELVDNETDHLFRVTILFMVTKLYPLSKMMLEWPITDHHLSLSYQWSK